MPLLTKGTRGRKRKHFEVSDLLSSSPRYPSVLTSVLPGAAVFENSIGDRVGHSTGATLAEVTDYYSKVLTKTADLKTACCTTSGTTPVYLQRALSRVHPDVSSKYYGCGFIAPELLEGLRVLDLGCGAGRDCYVLAQLVGERGQVVGVDMSVDQLATARGTIEWHREKFGYASANTSFTQAYLEKLLSREHVRKAAPVVTADATLTAADVHTDNHHTHSVHANTTALAIHPVDESDSDSDSDDETLDTTMRAFTAAARALTEGPALESEAVSIVVEAELTERSFDVIVSNCVVNLSPDKAAVLSNAFRLLKQGGLIFMCFFPCL